MTRTCKTLLPALFILLALSATASAQSTFLSLYSQPGDDFGGRPNINGKAFNYGEFDGIYQVNCFDMDNDGLVETVTLRLLPFIGSVGHWSLALSTRFTGVNMSPGYYDMASEGGAPKLSVANGFGCTFSSGSFSIIDAKFDYSNKAAPVVTSFAVKFNYYCGGGGTVGLLGTFYYKSSAIDFGAGPMQLSTSPFLPDWAVGSNSPRKIEISGGVAPYTYSLQSGLLPPGVTLASDGTLSGTPTRPGNYDFDVFVTDSVNILSNAHKLSTHLFLKVVDPPPPPPLSVLTDSIAGAMKGQSFNYQLDATGGRAPYEWSLAEGQLPPGLTVNPGGQLNGTPTAPGNFNFTLQVQDALTKTARRSYSLRVIDPPRIISVKYKAKKGKLTLSGEMLDPTVKLVIDGLEVTPNSHDETGLTVKKLHLSPGIHQIKLVNADGGTASVPLNVK